MAIFNLTASIGSRSGGASAAAKFDYITREGKYARGGDELREKESGNMPSWAVESPREYWAAADEYERANGRLYREVHAALPVELDAGRQRALARRLAQDLTAAERLPYTLVIHEGGGRNPHVHILWSERGNDGHDRSAETWFKRANSKDPARGGARKSSAANSRDWLPGLREQWAGRVNHALTRAGRPERVDHRSLAVQAAEARAQGDEDRAAELSREPKRPPRAGRRPVDRAAGPGEASDAHARGRVRGRAAQRRVGSLRTPVPPAASAISARSRSTATSRSALVA
jgi:hypothetical protein